MKLTEKDFPIAASSGHRDLIAHIRKAMDAGLGEGVVPVRFAITAMDGANYQCEFAALEGIDRRAARDLCSIFQFVPRKFERTGEFNAVFLVPTIALYRARVRFVADVR